MPRGKANWLSSCLNFSINSFREGAGSTLRALTSLLLCSTVFCCALLCYSVLCCLLLRSAAFCCVLLHSVAFCCVLLFPTVFCWVLLGSTVCDTFCSILLHYAVFCCLLLPSTVFCCVLLYVDTFCSILLHYAVFRFVVLHYSEFYCVLQRHHRHREECVSQQGQRGKENNCHSHSTDSHWLHLLTRTTGPDGRQRCRIHVQAPGERRGGRRIHTRERFSPLVTHHFCTGPCWLGTDCCSHHRELPWA